MAVLLVGLQGSGKSYKAMHDMHTQKDKFHKIYTNIDGLKETDKITSLNFNEFKNNILKPCHKMIVEEDKDFDEIIEYLKSINFLSIDVSENSRIMVVVDEAQNHFSKKDDVLSWFVTQHRHLFIELYLITQKETLLHADYRLFNVVYHAVPPVKQFNKSRIAYFEYAGLPLKEDNFVKKFSIKKDQKIFDMYVSGDKVESPNILKRFIIYGVLAIIVVIGLGMYLKNSLMHHDDKKEVPQEIIQNQKTTYTQNIEEEYNKYVVLNCIKETCKEESYNINLNIQDLEILLKNTDSKYLHANQLSKSRATLYLLVSSQFLELFNKNKGVRNEKGFNIIN